MIDIHNNAEMGKLITALAERIATTILADAFMEDYESELDEEIGELLEAANALHTLNYPIPFVVQEVFRLHGECHLRDVQVD
jgi:hypothetical protein